MHVSFYKITAKVSNLELPNMEDTLASKGQRTVAHRVRECENGLRSLRVPVYIYCLFLCHAGDRGAVCVCRQGSTGRPLLADHGGHLSQDDQVHSDHSDHRLLTDHSDHRLHVPGSRRSKRRFSPVVHDVFSTEYHLPTQLMHQNNDRVGLRFQCSRFDFDQFLQFRETIQPDR